MFDSNSKLMICNVYRDKIEKIIRLYPECRCLSVEDIVDCCLDLWLASDDVPSSGKLDIPDELVR